MTAVRPPARPGSLAWIALPAFLALTYWALLAWRLSVPAEAEAASRVTSSGARALVPAPAAPRYEPPRPVTSTQPAAPGGVLAMPIEGIDPGSLHDAFEEARGGRRHEAIDIFAPRGTPVVAVADGVVRKLFFSARGGMTVYQFDPAEVHCYYYAHLDAYAEGLHEGQAVTRGQRVGYVGSSGNAPEGSPHLHFAVYQLPEDKSWWKGVPLNPFPLLTGASSLPRT